MDSGEKFSCGITFLTPLVFDSPKILNQAIVILKLQKASITCLNNVYDTIIFHLNCKHVLRLMWTLIEYQSKNTLMQLSTLQKQMQQVKESNDVRLFCKKYISIDTVLVWNVKVFLYFLIYATALLAVHRTSKKQM